MNALLQIILQMNGSQQMMDGWGGGYGMILMIFFWLLILVLIVTLIWFLIRKGSESTSQADGGSALESLNKRYARGEIDKEEYLRMKKELNN